MAYVNTYLVDPSGESISLVHKTACEMVPQAFGEIKGRLICGIGNILRVYEMGKKKLLRKIDNRSFKSSIVQIRCEEGRIFVGDLMESVHVLKFKPEQGQLYTFADDYINRYLTSFTLLDEDTVAGVDKFENFFVIRMPVGCEEDAEDDPSASKQNWEKGLLNGAAFKLEKINQVFLGEVGTSIQKCKLSTNSAELILVSTSMGSLCALLPFETKQDIDFFIHLQMYLQIEAQPLCGRDHLQFRSSIEPLKDVVDGDLCQQFNQMDFAK